VSQVLDVFLAFLEEEDCSTALHIDWRSSQVEVGLSLAVSVTSYLCPRAVLLDLYSAGNQY
jgi:hypothetical protein